MPDPIPAILQDVAALRARIDATGDPRLVPALGRVVGLEAELRRLAGRAAASHIEHFGGATR